MTYSAHNQVRIAVVCILAVAAAFLAAGVVHVERRHRAVRAGYELSRATAERAHLAEENRRLRLEKSVLTAPQRIEELARTLGMRHPAAGQVRVVPRTATNSTRAGTRHRKREGASPRF